MPRYFFSDNYVMSTALLALLKDARKTSDLYRISTLDLSVIKDSGLEITGNTQHIDGLLQRIPGVVREPR